MSVKPRIAILTSLIDFTPGYSLNEVILSQARMLHRNGYPYDLLCLRGFNGEDRKRIDAEGLRVKYVLPQTVLVDYRTNEPPRPTVERTDKEGKLHKEVGFEEQVQHHLLGDEKTEGYIKALEPYDTVISHDLMFLSWHLPQNAALRACIDKWPDKNWLHWIHSGPSLKPPDCCYPSTLRYSAAPDSTYVFLNEGQRHLCALMLGTTRENIAVVYNARDPRDYYGMSTETCQLIGEYDLLDNEILEVYPFSTPRWREKGIRQLIRLFSHWKEAGVKATLVLVNANCNSPQDQPKLKEMEEYVARCNLELDRDVVITARFSDLMASRAEAGGLKQSAKDWKRWRYCVPARTVRELNLIANVFVFPSQTECCSLIQAEAAVAGKFMVLNRDFRPMQEFATPGVLSFEFNVNDPDHPEVLKRGYYECVAREILAELKNETAVVNAMEARRRWYNRDWIFKNQLEPLLWKKFSGRRISSPAAPEVGSVTAEPILDAAALPAVAEGPATVPAPVAGPRDGDPCSIWGTCVEDRRRKCFAEAGHCLLQDEEPPE